MLYAHKVLHAYLYGTRLLPCFPKHFERMCAVCVDIGSNIDCRRKRVAALSVPFENIYIYISCICNALWEHNDMSIAVFTPVQDLGSGV